MSRPTKGKGKKQIVINDDEKTISSQQEVCSLQVTNNLVKLTNSFGDSIRGALQRIHSGKIKGNKRDLTDLDEATRHIPSVVSTMDIDEMGYDAKLALIEIIDIEMKYISRDENYSKEKCVATIKQLLARAQKNKNTLDNCVKSVIIVGGGLAVKYPYTNFIYYWNVLQGIVGSIAKELVEISISPSLLPTEKFAIISNAVSHQLIDKIVLGSYKLVDLLGYINSLLGNKNTPSLQSMTDTMLQNFSPAVITNEPQEPTSIWGGAIWSGASEMISGALGLVNSKVGNPAEVSRVTSRLMINMDSLTDQGDLCGYWLKTLAISVIVYFLILLCYYFYIKVYRPKTLETKLRKTMKDYEASFEFGR